jgi:UDP-N-acetylglucosamine 4,6-dehydratase
MQFTGIRPGEKIHESLLAENEARHTLDVGEMYVVEPLFQWWGKENWKKGAPLSEEFTYTSNGNSRSLSILELRELVGIPAAEAACV